ncbi:MAG TPA: septum formation family protein [Kineosporiaceae bacterium]|nr:septum formation family protein [Kineosporiaceae bacterium]
MANPPGQYPPVPPAAVPAGQYPPAPAPPGHYSFGYGTPTKVGTDGFAIAALVLSILGGVVLSVVFALIALPRIRRNRTSGKGMAIAALVVSGGWVLLLIAGITFAALTSAHRDGAGTVTSGGTLNARSVKVGDCIEGFNVSTTVRSVHAVPCTQPHNAEVIGEFSVADGTYPGENEIRNQAEMRCSDLIPSDLGSLDPQSLHLYYFYPMRSTWALHDRTVHCIIGSDTPLTTAIGHT